jgi:hypothetical protein
VFSVVATPVIELEEDGVTEVMVIVTTGFDCDAPVALAAVKVSVIGDTMLAVVGDVACSVVLVTSGNWRDVDVKDVALELGIFELELVALELELLGPELPELGLEELKVMLELELEELEALDELAELGLMLELEELEELEELDELDELLELEEIVELEDEVDVVLPTASVSGKGTKVVIAIVVVFSVMKETVVCSAVNSGFPSSSLCATAELVMFGKLLCNLGLD